MQFRLVYEGEIRSRQQAGLAAVHDIRAKLAPQVKMLWEYPPLNQSQDWLKNEGSFHACTEHDGWHFASAVSSAVGLYGEVDILILRPQPPGSIVSKQGDLDNKLKTLIDALTVPTLQQVRELQRLGLQAPQGLMHCAFSDDNLISRLSVTSDRLLCDMSERRSIAVINVTLKVGKPCIDNIHLS